MHQAEKFNVQPRTVEKGFAVRRVNELGMKVKIGCHTFRATGITAYLEAGGSLRKCPGHGRARKPPAPPSSMIAHRR
jgi:hypothetical protein